MHIYIYSKYIKIQLKYNYLKNAYSDSICSSSAIFSNSNKYRMELPRNVNNSDRLTLGPAFRTHPVLVESKRQAYLALC